MDAISSAPSKVLIGGGSEGPSARLGVIFPVARSTVYRTHTGQETLERAAEVEPDVIILEASLPDMTGADVCRTLLAQYVPVTTPVLFATPTPPDDVERLTAIRAGARECVGPWMDEEALQQLVAAYYQGKLEADRGLTEALVDAATGLYNRRGLLRRGRELGSHASRCHEALACVVIAVELDPKVAEPTAAGWARRWGQEVQAAARVADVVGRVEADCLAVLAPATDGPGAVRMTRRLADATRTTASQIGRSAAELRIRAGYDAVTNVRHTPVDPATLLMQATAAVHSGRPEPGVDWIRRFDRGFDRGPEFRRTPPHGRAT